MRFSRFKAANSGGSGPRPEYDVANGAQMNKIILVIDDDPSVRGAFKLVLSESGYIVREAESGLQGIEMVQAERPDLIFLDLKMPGLDGVETLRRLKALDASLNVYIVTAFSHEYMAELKAAYTAGIQFQVASKPLSSAQIRQIAKTAQHVPGSTKDDHKLMLTLYIASANYETQILVEKFTTVLAALYAPGRWMLDVVEVLSMPEKALENDVFATPMLVRDLPEPVLRLLGDLSKMPSVMAAITTQHAAGVETMIV
jgi:CheY-like chemotaxis protein